ncbi:hypothetical protein L2E82_50799 [Cichorium intybus]|nr:hypothetical protein L2E82_50799 [Cichorium intybus]
MILLTTAFAHSLINLCDYVVYRTKQTKYSHGSSYIIVMRFELQMSHGNSTTTNFRSIEERMSELPFAPYCI